jgi:hypothetical protein
VVLVVLPLLTPPPLLLAIFAYTNYQLSDIVWA